MDDVPETLADDDMVLTPTAAMATEARRALGWVDQGKASVASHLEMLGRSIADRAPLTGLDVEDIIATYEGNRNGLSDDGGKAGEPGFPNTWRAHCSIVGGADGYEWAIRQRRRLERAGADTVTAASNPGDGTALAPADTCPNPGSTLEEVDMEPEPELAVTAAGDTLDPDVVVVASAAGDRPMFRLIDQGESDAICAAGGFMLDAELATRLEWESVLVLEGFETGDGRFIDMGALTWELPPLTLWSQLHQAPGHDGAGIAGSILHIVRDGNVIIGYGAFDSGEWGQETRRMIEEGSIKGVSVDMDWISYEMRARDGSKPDAEADLFEMLFLDDMVTAFTDARIRAATVCGIPAFAEAWIRCVDPEYFEESPAVSIMPGAPMRGVRSGTEPIQPRKAAADTVTAAGWFADAVDRGAEAVMFMPFENDEGVIVAAANAGARHQSERTGARSLLSDDIRASLLRPPAAWFDDDSELFGFDRGSVTVDLSTGRVRGFLATWDAVHIGVSGERLHPPRPTANGFAAFHGATELMDGIVGPKILTAEGIELAVGTIVIESRHPSKRKDASDSYIHYHDTGCVVAAVRAHETPVGIYVTGALHPEISDEQLYSLRLARVSGDWRRMDAGLELVAILGVTNAGFNPAVVASAADDDNVIPAREVTGGGVYRALVAAASGEVHAMLGGDSRIELVTSPQAHTDGLAARVEAVEEWIAGQEAAAREARLAGLSARFGMTPAEAQAALANAEETRRARLAAAFAGPDPMARFAAHFA